MAMTSIAYLSWTLILSGPSLRVSSVRPCASASQNRSLSCWARKRSHDFLLPPFSSPEPQPLARHPQPSRQANSQQLPSEVELQPRVPPAQSYTLAIQFIQVPLAGQHPHRDAL